MLRHLQCVTCSWRKEENTPLHTSVILKQLNEKLTVLIQHSDYFTEKHLFVFIQLIKLGQRGSGRVKILQYIYIFSSWKNAKKWAIMDFWQSYFNILIWVANNLYNIWTKFIKQAHTFFEKMSQFQRLKVDPRSFA